MSSLLDCPLADMCNTRLALIAETAGNFEAQLLDLMKLRDQVRKAERIRLGLPTPAMARERALLRLQ
jgi:hypothetical protein